MLPDVHWSWPGFFQLVGAITCAALTLYIVVGGYLTLTMDTGPMAPFIWIWKKITSRRT